MKTQHTPGPWEVHPHYESVYASGKRICIIVPQGGSLKPFDKENALLIAAAPETAAERDRLKEINSGLLNALENLCQQVARDCSISSDTKYFELFQRHQEALQAIKKAKQQ